MNSKRNHSNAAGPATVRPERLRAILGGLLIGLAVAAPVPVFAQTSPAAVEAAPAPAKHYMSKSAFFLPVNIDERARAGIREVQLFVKESPGAAWVFKEKASPAQAGFNYRLPQDGEYWFTVVTIDRAGKAIPADLSKEPPGIIVVLDTKGPHVELKPLPPNPEGICVLCDVHDANPNPFLTRFEYQTGDRNWRSLESAPNQPECFCIPRQAVLTGMVRVSCTDRAQNTTVREFNLTSIGLSTDGAPVAQNNPGKVVQPIYVEKNGSNPVAQQAQYTPAVPPSAVGAGKSTVATPNSFRLFGTDFTELTSKAKSLPSCPHNAGCSENGNNPKPGADLHMVNNPHLALEYKIEAEGQSGIGKVEVWITKDGGRTWDVLCEDHRRKSPVEFDLPGEGVFGLRLVVSNGRGFGASPPKAGDAPEYVVELDTSKPHAEILTVKLGPPEDNACVDISWVAVDKNFGTGPIDLYYAITPQGPWTPIAKGLLNSGKYRWYLPREIGKQAYVRLVATDLAGNSTRCEVAEPVALDDMSRPSARIVGISTTPQGMTPTGN